MIAGSISVHQIPKRAMTELTPASLHVINGAAVTSRVRGVSIAPRGSQWSQIPIITVSAGLGPIWSPLTDQTVNPLTTVPRRSSFPSRHT